VRIVAVMSLQRLLKMRCNVGYMPSGMLGTCYNINTVCVFGMYIYSIYNYALTKVDNRETVCQTVHITCVK